MKPLLRSLAFVFLSTLAGPTAWADPFPIKHADLWVMVGDSITAQRLHTVYFEAYCQTRFPQHHLRFRNSGVGGDTIPRALNRFPWDVQDWGPTVISVELGMNDSGAGPDSTAQFIDQMKEMLRRIRDTHARPVLLAPSPVNDGTTSPSLEGRNVTLDRYSTALGALAGERGLPWADQFHALLDRWGSNKDVSLGGNPVHPGPTGQLMMAAALLMELNAPSQVSSAVFDAETKTLVDAQRCDISRLSFSAGRVRFERLDATLPMPIPTAAADALKLMPEILTLSDYTLTVKNLSPGQYAVKIDGETVATLDAQTLAEGFNLTPLTAGAIARQCQRVVEMIHEKDELVQDARDSQKQLLADPGNEELQRKLGDMPRKIQVGDQTIHAGVQPLPHRFEIVPVSP